MAPHSSTVARKIPWMEEPGRLQSMGSHRVEHDWSDLAAFVLFKEILFKSLLMKVEEENGKAGSKLNIQKTKNMASGPIT